MIRLYAVILAVASVPAFGQSAAQRAEAFLASVQAGEINQAVDSAFAGSGISEQDPVAIPAVKMQIQAISNMYGKSNGFEKACEIDLSPSFKRLVYVQKFANFPVAWQFYYYNPGNGWRLNSLKFKDQGAEILDTCT